jgi:transcriptional regulator with XRE-family HTH domain
VKVLPRVEIFNPFKKVPLSHICHLNGGKNAGSGYLASPTFAMKSTQKKMLATLVKEGRMAKGLTQKDLSELTNISTRSIQRIENGELTPRLFTIKALADALGFSMEEVGQEEKKNALANKSQRIILTIGSFLFIVLLAFAFIAQSTRFPETQFEGFLFSSCVILVMTSAFFLIWRNRE